MKIPRCRKTLGSGSKERQCLLDEGHEKAQKYVSPDILARPKGTPHEFAPVCPSCDRVEFSDVGAKRNIRVPDEVIR